MPTTEAPSSPSADQRRARREEARRKVVRQRRIVALAALLMVVGGVVALVTAVGSSGNSTKEASARAHGAPPRSAKPKPPPELPGGGRTLFPSHRVVAYYGAPGSDQLGQLGIGTPTQAGKALLAQMHPYRRGGRHLLPAMELIAVVATGGPQDDNTYAKKQSYAVVDRYLAAARRIHGLLILDIQPGHAQFMDLVKHYTLPA